MNKVTLFYKPAGLSVTQMMRLTLAALCLIGFSLVPENAGAQLVSAPSGTCTTDAQFNIPKEDLNSGLILSIIYDVEYRTNYVMSELYNYIVQDSGFMEVVPVAFTLYIAIYSIFFIFGMLQATFADFLVRLAKIGAIIALTSPGSWNFFFNHVVWFFNGSTNSIIAMMLNIVLPNVPIWPGDYSALGGLDWVLAQAISVKMFVTILAMVFTGPYGLLFGLLLVLGIASFLRALLVALWVYLMSMILRALLFGVAPIFIICMLFKRTRHLFDGWLNQVLNACLQPILLFTFFSFFAVLIGGAIEVILGNRVCWSEAQESLRGTPFYMHFWRFMVPGNQGWEPFGGTWDFYGARTDYGTYLGYLFPINLFLVLMLVILGELANRFNMVVTMIAGNLASASTNLAHMDNILAGIAGPGKRPESSPADGRVVPRDGTAGTTKARSPTAGSIASKPAASNAAAAAAAAAKSAADKAGAESSRSVAGLKQQIGDMSSNR